MLGLFLHLEGGKIIDQFMSRFLVGEGMKK